MRVPETKSSSSSQYQLHAASLTVMLFHIIKSLTEKLLQAGCIADIMDLTEDDTPTESCTICLDDVLRPRVHVIGGCLHRFCLTCLQTHTHKKLEDRQYPIPCPHPNCDTAITDAECDLILRSSQDRQLLAQVIDGYNE